MSNFNNIESVAVTERFRVMELEVSGNTLNEVRSSIKKAIEDRVNDILSDMELAASVGRPEDIVRYNNALQNMPFVKQEMTQRFIEQAEALWKYKKCSKC